MNASKNLFINSQESQAQTMKDFDANNSMGCSYGSDSDENYCEDEDQARRVKYAVKAARFFTCGMATGVCDAGPHVSNKNQRDQVFTWHMFQREICHVNAILR